LLTVAAAGLVLVFMLWWSYFKHEATEEIRQSLRWTFVWSYGHYLIFAALAVLGTGLQLATETLAHGTHITPTFAAFTVAIPVATYLVVLALLRFNRKVKPAALPLTLLTAFLILAAATATPLFTLPATTVIVVVLTTLLLAYHLAICRPPDSP
jgi:low temperature requirement protein LtrA